VFDCVCLCFFLCCEIARVLGVCEFVCVVCDSSLCLVLCFFVCCVAAGVLFV
jgi:hypothetical protein